MSYHNQRGLKLWLITMQGENVEMEINQMIKDYISGTGICSRCSELKDRYPVLANRLFNDQYGNVIMLPENLEVIDKNIEENFHIVDGKIIHLKFSDNSPFIYDYNLRKYLENMDSTLTMLENKKDIIRLTQVEEYMFYASRWTLYWEAIDTICIEEMKSGNLYSAVIAILEASIDKISHYYKNKIFNELDLKKEISRNNEENNDYISFARQLQEIVVARAEKYHGWYPRPTGNY